MESNDRPIRSEVSGPIPDEILSEVFYIAEQRILEELQRSAEEEGVDVESVAVTGLELGYYAPLKEREDLGEAYYIRSGEVPLIEELPEEDINEEDLDRAENPLSFDQVDQLAAEFTAQLEERTSGDILIGRSLSAYFSATYSYNFNRRCGGYQCCFNAGRRRWRWYVSNGRCKHTPCRGGCPNL